MLGCKYIHLTIHTVYMQELIDTCWDVNIIAPGITHLSFLELIDTCWDVNEEFATSSVTIDAN